MVLLTVLGILGLLTTSEQTFLSFDRQGFQGWTTRESGRRKVYRSRLRPSDDRHRRRLDLGLRWRGNKQQIFFLIVLVVVFVLLSGLEPHGVGTSNDIAREARVV
jgi:hypothetical protein